MKKINLKKVVGILGAVILVLGITIFCVVKRKKPAEKPAQEVIPAKLELPEQTSEKIKISLSSGKVSLQPGEKYTIRWCYNSEFELEYIVSENSLTLKSKYNYRGPGDVGVYEEEFGISSGSLVCTKFASCPDGPSIWTLHVEQADQSILTGMLQIERKFVTPDCKRFLNSFYK